MPSALLWLRQLRLARATFGDAAERAKQQALAELALARLSSLSQLVQLHEDLLFLCAFPGDAGTRATAVAQLARFSRRWRALPPAARVRLENSGIAGTVSRPSLAWPVARRLIATEIIDIDWANLEEPAAFDALVARLACDSERESYESGDYTTRSWIELVRPQGERVAAWIVRQGTAIKRSAGFAAAWDAAQVPLRWTLADSPRSITHARLAVKAVTRRTGLRRLDRPAAEHIVRPLDGIRLLDRSAASRIIDLARSALTSRAREVHAMNYPNPAEVYEADLGEGVALALIGVAPAVRLTLEANYGYLLLSNGVPIGYGGVSPLYRQANTGINVFDAFRGSEAAFLWAQTLRAFRTLFGTRRFVINGYQFGAGNSEAIASGAYWFYYRLGFRPSLEDNVAAAAAEADRLRRQPSVRTKPAVLRRLARGDLHLDLADFRAGDFFEELLLTRLGAAVARRIAALPVRSHEDGEDWLVSEVRKALGLRGLLRWPVELQRGFRRLAPYAALIDLPRWKAEERRALSAWLRAKGDVTEREFAVQAAGQGRFFATLRDVARAEVERSHGHG